MTPLKSLIESLKGSGLRFVSCTRLQLLQPTCYRLGVYEPFDILELNIPRFSWH